MYMTVQWWWCKSPSRQRCEGDYNQFLVAVPSTRSRHARSSHTVLVRVYLQGYGLFIQIFLGEVQFATLCEDTTVQ